MTEKYTRQFSHNLYLSERKKIADWIRAVRQRDHPEDDRELHWAGIQFFTNLGRTPMYDRENRARICGQMVVIERQRARNKAKEPCAIPADGV